MKPLKRPAMRNCGSSLRSATVISSGAGGAGVTSSPQNSGGVGADGGPKPAIAPFLEQAAEQAAAVVVGGAGIGVIARGADAEEGRCGEPEIEAPKADEVAGTAVVGAAAVRRRRMEQIRQAQAERGGRSGIDVGRLGAGSVRGAAQQAV